MITVGISAYYHDAACCLLRDGHLVAAAQEERFSRRKHDPSLPVQAFRYCLAEAGVSIAGVDALAFYEDPELRTGRQIWTALVGAPQAAQGPVSRNDSGSLERDIRERLGYEGSILKFPHHHSHAASAYYYSGFPEAAILTVDGVGEWTTMAYGRGSGGSMELFEQVHFPHSLGLLYSTITTYLGFSANDGEYKVMGLAAYGTPRYKRQVRRLVESAPGAQIRLRAKYFDYMQNKRMYSDDLCSLFGAPARTKGSEVLPLHADIASSMQTVLEEILLEKVSYLFAQAPSANLCMAGGVALNCVANARILRDGPFRSLFVQPAAGDAGGALGAAALAYRMRTGGIPEPLTDVYLGPAYDSSEMASLLDAMGIEFLDCREDEPALIDATVDALRSGSVVGWYQGRMEFGPRALGARSILADPRDACMRDRVNSLIKKREEFRPFAPAILESRAPEHFDLDHPSPFMLETCRVTSRLPLPAITHIDGTARVQTVGAGANPRYVALLQAFERATGCPILLNTSFNMSDEPIVCTPAEALLCAIRSKMDMLVLGDFVVRRAGIPEIWMDVYHSLYQQPSPAVSHSVYAMA